MSRSRLRLLLAAALLLAVPACAPRSTTSAGGTGDGDLHLRVLATHDFHGALRPVVYSWSHDRPVGGAPALKAVLDSAEARCGCPTVRLDGGDLMQGSLESNLVYGTSVVQAFNLMGLDAAAVGNHELDWGVDTLLVRQHEAHYAWLAANVFRVDDGKRPEWAKPYQIVERDGLRVAVVGYATVTTPQTLRPAVTAPYRFVAGVDGIRDALEAVGRRNPDFTVIVAHAGGDCRGDRCAGEMATLAAQLPPGSVQLIVGGHDHTSGEGVVNGIPIIRASSSARAVGVVDLYRHADGSRDFTIERDTVYADAVGQDQQMVALLERYQRRADSVGRTPVARLAERLVPGKSPRLGNLIADALRVSANADFGLHNPGGVRAELPAGVATYADLFRVMPFDNRVVRLSLTGRQLREVVEYSLSRRPYHFSNLHLVYDPSAPLGHRLVSWSFADGRPIADDETYTLGLVDFLADGGDGFTMLSDLPQERTGVLVLDAVIEYLKGLPEPVVAPSDQRTVAKGG